MGRVRFYGVFPYEVPDTLERHWLRETKIRITGVSSLCTPQNALLGMFAILLFLSAFLCSLLTVRGENSTQHQGVREVPDPLPLLPWVWRTGLCTSSKGIVKSNPLPSLKPRFIHEHGYALASMALTSTQQALAPVRIPRAFPLHAAVHHLFLAAPQFGVCILIWGLYR